MPTADTIDVDRLITAAGWSRDAIEINGWTLHSGEGWFDQLPQLVERELEPLTTQSGAVTNWFWDEARRRPTDAAVLPAPCSAGRPALQLLSDRDFDVPLAIGRSPSDILFLWPISDLVGQTHCFGGDVEHTIWTEDQSLIATWYGLRFPPETLSRQQLDDCVANLAANLRYHCDYSTREATRLGALCREAFLEDDDDDSFFGFINSSRAALPESARTVTFIVPD